MCCDWLDREDWNEKIMQIGWNQTKWLNGRKMGSKVMFNFVMDCLKNGHRPGHGARKAHELIVAIRTRS